MTRDIIDISLFFMPSAEDKDELRKLIEIAGNKDKWPKAKEYFEQTRRKALKVQNNDNTKLNELYSFIEVCLKSLYNLTHPNAPFDPDSPYKVVKNALKYCRAVSLNETELIEIIG